MREIAMTNCRAARRWRCPSCARPIAPRAPATTPPESLEVALSRLGLARASQLLKTLPSIRDAEML